MSTPNSDQRSADREGSARQHLIDAGASALPRPPWLHSEQPPSAIDLMRFAVWLGQRNDITDADVEAALALVPAARAEIDHIETATLFTARAQGMSWARIGRELGLGSAQAASQRSDRLANRVESTTKT